MPFDKYHDWAIDNWGDKSKLMEQLLKDLSGVSNDTDKLELLDSFEVYVMRFHREELAKLAAMNIVKLITPFITSGIRDKIPYPYPPTRPRTLEES